MATAEEHTKRRHETPEVAKASMRFARALARRAEEGDTEALEGLAELALIVEGATATAMANLHNAGYSWASIAELLGTSKQAAHQRYNRILARQERSVAGG